MLSYQRLDEEQFPDHIFIFKTVPCPNCGSVVDLRIPAEHYQRYIDGHLPQFAFAGLNAGERERLITGFCGDCYDLVFVEEE